MCARPALTACDSPSSPRIHRRRFTQNRKRLDMKDAKVALDIVIRPSLHLLKLADARNVLPILKRHPKQDRSPCSTPKKKVRFDEQPTTISSRGFFGRFRRDPCPSPARPCLVVRVLDDAVVRHKHPKAPVETDCHSVYEDCLSDHPGFLADFQVFDGDDRLDTRPLECVRRSDFYETESGIAMFDRTGYANYCFSRWLDKQQEEARLPKKPVFEDPALLPWPSRTLPPPPASNPQNVARPLPPPFTRLSRPPRSLPLRIWKHVEDELHNAVFVLTVGLFIHICLYLFLLYDILVRGFVPSDD